MLSMNSGLFERKPSEAWLVAMGVFFLLEGRLWEEVGRDFREGAVAVDGSFCCSLLFNCSLNGVRDYEDLQKRKGVLFIMDLHCKTWDRGTCESSYKGLGIEL